MLPPVLEIFVVWHPQDGGGRDIATEFIEHFHGTVFSGLIGGAVEVFTRSEGWRSESDAPRPIPLAGAHTPNGVSSAKFTAVVPILGNGMAAAVEDTGPWRTFIDGLQTAQQASPQAIAVLPFRLHAPAMNGTRLAALMGRYQTIGTGPMDAADTPANLRCRDLAQSLSQFVAGDPRRQIRIFISHTKRASTVERANIRELIKMVREAITATRLGEFFDAHDLQPGTDWSDELKANAANSAFLALRSDLYPTREWCQKEMLVAKLAGMPVVIVDAVGFAEERGSYLMDHVPRVPVHVDGASWSKQDVFRALNLLVDECLKRELWKQQQALATARPDLEISWWAPHAPELLTLIDWLDRAKAADQLPAAPAVLRILHPDPPLGPDERKVLAQMLDVAGLPDQLDVMTPRQLAGRGG